jgi:aminoglycoside phosphotransferase (APT) family kinase protein
MSEQALLTHLEAAGLGAPAGWEIGGEAAAVDDEALSAVGRLIRSCHDATSGWAPPDARWRHLPGAPDGGDVICHNSLGPESTVFRDGRPVAFVHWQLAAPGPRAWDLAHAVWRFAPFDASGDPEVAGARARVLLDAYGLTERAGFVALVRERMRVLRETIRAGAEAGEPAWLAMWGTEHSEGPLADRAWVARHRRALEAAIGG